ncbi:hypothetical protein ABC502_07760 [Alkalimonas sp. NCh-2]|uniref:hypothetical protein n=1 Tax=Alkalimonas sp. NCh-2 TaxID=3144846 RepID=UPI0031F627E0
MKLNAIIMIMNTFFAPNQGSDQVMAKVITPIKQISAETSINDADFKAEKQAIDTAASFLRELDFLNLIDEANKAIYSFYEDIDSFKEFLASFQQEHKVDFAEFVVRADGMTRSIMDDMDVKISGFESHVLKRGPDIEALANAQLLRKSLIKGGRFFSELTNLVNQTGLTHVDITGSFLSDEDVAALAKDSAAHFEAMMS